MATPRVRPSAYAQDERALSQRHSPHAPLRCEGGLQEASLRHDCALYFRDLAVAAIIFLPIWSLLYLLRVLVLH